MITNLVGILLQFSSQWLAVSMTPKTLRVPKPGEMLLSVHGSPLGVYKDDNMEAIHGMFLTVTCVSVISHRHTYLHEQFLHSL